MWKDAGAALLKVLLDVVAPRADRACSDQGAGGITTYERT